MYVKKKDFYFRIKNDTGEHVRSRDFRQDIPKVLLPANI